MIGRRSHDDAQSFNDALDGARPVDEQTAELVRLAEGLCEAAAAEPSQVFRESLRAQLMTEAATVLVPMAPTPARTKAASPVRAPRGRRRLASLTAAGIASVGVVGLVASSASAVPGEMLYPVKRTVESVELQIHRDDASRGKFQLDRASERLAEARQLNADSGSADLIAETLDDFSAAASDGSTRLFTEFDSTGKKQSITQVNDFAAAASVGLSELSSQLPDGAADSLDAAKTAVTDLAAEASTLCAACTPADVRALASAVQDLAAKKPSAKGQTPASPPVAAPSGRPSPTKAAPSTGSSTPTSRPPAAATAPAPVPVPTPPVKTPSLTDITDPLLGGLLGDEEQPGLVPGLLDGLLGGLK